MANTYKAVTRIKCRDDDGSYYLERGDEVVGDDVGGDDALQELVDGGSVMEADRFDEMFPEAEQGENQRPGTPSNLEQVTGTPLAANPDEGGVGDSSDASAGDQSDAGTSASSGDSGTTSDAGANA